MHECLYRPFQQLQGFFKAVSSVCQHVAQMIQGPGIVRLQINYTAQILLRAGHVAEIVVYKNPGEQQLLKVSEK